MQTGNPIQMICNRNLPLAVVTLACTAWAYACGGDGGTEPPQPPPDPSRPTTVTVNPATAELTALGATAQLSAEVRDQNGQVMVVTVTWSSNNAAVATVNVSGLVTAAGNGTATITATAGAVSGSATVTVAQQVSAVEITPDTGIVLPGTTLQLAAEAQDANGHAVAGSEFAWASSDTTVAVVDGTGLVTGIALGSAEVSAISSGAAGRAHLEVLEPAPTTVAVTPDTVMFDALGDTRQLTAEVQDQAGRPMPDEVVMWTASDTLVATVDASGLVTAVGNGAATITATSGEISGDAAIEVMQVARRVTLSPRADTLILGDTLRVAAEALDGNGHPVAGAAFSWSSSDTAIATVGTTGVVQGVGEGTAEITAATGSVHGVARITVFNPDRAPLVALYNATNGPDWVNSDNWLTDKPLGQWHGVHTDAFGRVHWVVLHGQQDSEGNWARHGLEGTLPAELGRLDKLKGLLLFGNELSGTIPPELGDLASLERLDLSGNELTGPIPPELGRLVNLKHLWLQQNALEDAIPPDVGDLAQLESLHLDNNDLSGRIPPGLAELASLERLDLSHNALTGPIPAALAGLASLKTLILSDNELTGPIPPGLGNLASLARLFLYQNELTGPVPSEFGRLTNLIQLSLNGNGLAGPIPSSLGNLTQLRELLLDDNELSGPIPPELGNLTGLEWLTVSRNGLTGPIPSTLGNLKELTVLSLGENALTGSIPRELGGTSLQGLDLRSNDLTGPIPPELGDLIGLTTLLLSDNDLAGPIPAELGDLRALTVLALSRNALSGPVPARLGGLMQLELLLLEDNELEGSVPPELGALTALREFNLTNSTAMAGALPAELTSLTRLDVLLAGGTELCVPSEVEFETWLAGIWRRRVRRCPEASPSTAYLTQAVQSREHPVPLMAGNEALLRVFVTARQTTREGIPPVRARFFVNDQEIHAQDIAGRLSPIPTGVDEGSLGRSANAVIPGRVIQPGLEMVIDVDPDGTLDPGLGVAKRIPETGRLRVDVHDMPPMDLTLIPFLWEENPDQSILDLVTGMAADPHNHEMLHLTRTLLPIAELHVRAHEPVVFPTNDVWELLRATQAIRAMEGGTGFYKGMMSGELSGGAGGLGPIPGRTSFSQPHGPTMAHELGHNMSLEHAPCGDPFPPNPEPAFPQPDGSIGAWGYDFRSRTLVHPSFADIMGYCPPREWIGGFHFSNALRFRLSDYDHPALPDRAGQTTATLLVWGGVDGNGAPFLEPAFVVDAPARLPDAAGDHRVVGRTADGAELFSMSFAMPDVPDGDGSSAFAFTVPVQSSWAGTLASITLSGPGGSVVLDGDSERAVAIVRNPRSGQVRGFLRGVSAEDAFQVAAMAGPGAGAALEVLFSRGIPDAAAWPG